MRDALKGLADGIRNAADKVSDKAIAVVNHEHTQAVIEWTRQSATTVVEETAEFSKRAIRSEIAKDAATGASIGAALAVPIPVLGPAVGAVVGAGMGVLINLQKGDDEQERSKAEPPALSGHDLTAQLLSLDELRQKGILTQDEFDQKKREILDRL